MNKEQLKVGVSEDGMLVISPIAPFIPEHLSIAAWRPNRGERRIWYQSSGAFFVPRGSFHIHFNGTCSQLSWDGMRLIDTDNGVVLLDVNKNRPELLN